MDATKVEKRRERQKVDVAVKKVVRAFRAFLKSQYKEMYGVRYYYWVPGSMKINTHEFFKKRYPNISYEEYMENENALVVLIHNTKSRQEIKNITASRAGATVNLFRDVFGSKPNRKNLEKFFAQPVIQRLWFSDSGFYKSTMLEEIITGMDWWTRQRFFRLFTEVQPAGLSLL